MTSEKILYAEAERLSEQHGLSDWTFVIEDEHPTIEECAGFTDFEQKRITVYRELWPTSEHNMIEVVRHEYAHAVLGNGDHTPEWWDALTSKCGGDGVWEDDKGTPAPWSWTREKTL